MQTSFPFDAVLFDLDGTLVATDRFWVQAARTGARRAFQELGLEREIPSAADWMSLVGQPLDAGFATLFADLGASQRKRVQAICVEEEHRLLDAGGAAWMPGGESALSELRERGVQIGIASNCSRAYLEHMLSSLGVGRFAHEARCLDSPGVTNKADMIEGLLDSFQTRSAVFVGDRVGDRDSAWANSIPHVHCAFGFAGAGEAIEAQAVIEDLGELLPRLSQRDAWIESALERAGVFRASRKPPFAVGVTGLPLAGKSLFARDAARLTRERGIPAAAAELAAWQAQGEQTKGGGAHASSSEDPLAGVDLGALERDLLTPLLRGDRVRCERTILDPLAPAQRHLVDLDPGGVLFLAGDGLLDPRLIGRLERTVWLEIGEDEALRRAAGREGRAFGPAPLEALRAGRLPGTRVHRERYDPERLADLVLAAGNPLGPDARSASEPMS